MLRSTTSSACACSPALTLPFRSSVVQPSIDVRGVRQLRATTTARNSSLARLSCSYSRLAAVRFLRALAFGQVATIAVKKMPSTDFQHDSDHSAEIRCRPCATHGASIVQPSAPVSPGQAQAFHVLPVGHVIARRKRSPAGAWTWLHSTKIPKKFCARRIVECTRCAGAHRP